MKRKLLIGLLVLALLLPTASFATEAGDVAAYDPGMFFTHPELGEQVLVDYHYGMPEIIVYGMTVYEVVPTVEQPYRGGMIANDITVVNDDMLDPYDTLELFYVSSETDEDGTPPFQYEYAGLSEGYAEKLQALPEEERFDVLMLLYGFRGADGYELLKGVPGFEDIDVETLKSDYREYTVVINGVEYPYRVIMFRVEEEGGVVYYERYNFIYHMNEWRLARITKEYVEEFDERVLDIYGTPTKAELEEVASADTDAHRNLPWSTNVEDVIALEGGALKDNTLTKESVEIYKLVADLEYVFDDDGKLLYREFKFKDEVSFYSAFVSLYMRYADPIEITNDKNKTWILDDVVIQLVFDDQNPTLRFTTRDADSTKFFL